MVFISTKIFLLTILFEALFVITLSCLPKISPKIVEKLTFTPGLDLVLLVILPLPWLIGFMQQGLLGLILAILAQIIVMEIWAFIHEKINFHANARPCINQFYNQKFGWWRNNFALYITTLALPVFFLIRFCQIFCYKPLVWLLNFPDYQHSEWVNVSRQKFTGLIGHDLIWCLYCDWMTGVYSLGAEMLRNVESFWCPIRFDDEKKCLNCQLDFPDINQGWVAADSNINEVEKVIKEKYSKAETSWFGHPNRKK